MPFLHLKSARLILDRGSRVQTLFLVQRPGHRAIGERSESCGAGRGALIAPVLPVVACLSSGLSVGAVDGACLYRRSRDVAFNVSGVDFGWSLS